VDQLPDHDRLVEEELFARLAVEMGPMIEIPGRRARLRTGLAVALVVLGLVTVVLGLSGPLVVSAVGYSAALFGLVTLAPALAPVLPWLRTRLAGLRRLPY
jgi:hypothetical protein